MIISAQREGVHGTFEFSFLVLDLFYLLICNALKAFWTFKFKLIKFLFILVCEFKSPKVFEIIAYSYHTYHFMDMFHSSFLIFSAVYFRNGSRTNNEEDEKPVVVPVMMCMIMGCACNDFKDFGKFKFANQNEQNFISLTLKVQNSFKALQMSK